MARPIKMNADFFGHDNDLRNHRKIKVLRNKFGAIQGYAFYVMMLEWLTGCDNLRWHYTESEIEMFSADLGIDSVTAKEMVKCCLDLDLLQMDDGHIVCNSLIERLEPMFAKRHKMRGYCGNNSVISGNNSVIASESTQSKVKESKVKESKGIRIEKIKTKTENVADKMRLLVVPFDSQNFASVWLDWQRYRSERKSKLTLSTAKKQLEFLSKFNEIDAIKIIEQSILNGWIGLFELKNNNNGKKLNYHNEIAALYSGN